MCVVAFAIDYDPRWRFVLAGNRDEFHARQAEPLDRWKSASHVIAGRDKQAGGSWLGVSEQGRLAVVTNIRMIKRSDPAKASRGALV
ncbi:MAG: NRDE family protein, partial [Sphingorhabdus sp.]